jgi:hypothetical protein
MCERSIEKFHCNNLLFIWKNIDIRWLNPTKWGVAICRKFVHIFCLENFSKLGSQSLFDIVNLKDVQIFQYKLLIVVFFQHSIYQMAICTVQSTNMNALCTKKIQHNILMNEYQNGNNLSTLFHLVAIEMLSILQDALWILSIILRFLWEIIEEVQITKLTNEEYKLTKRQHYWIEILQTEFSNRFTFTSKGPSFS